MTDVDFADSDEQSMLCRQDACFLLEDACDDERNSNHDAMHMNATERDDPLHGLSLKALKPTSQKGRPHCSVNMNFSSQQNEKGAQSSSSTGGNHSFSSPHSPDDDAMTYEDDGTCDAGEDFWPPEEDAMEHHHCGNEDHQHPLFDKVNTRCRSLEDIVDASAFAELVQQTKDNLRAEAARKKALWVSQSQQDLIDQVPPALRLPGLLAEARRYELSLLSKLTASAKNGGANPNSAASRSDEGANDHHLATTEMKQNLSADVIRSYHALLREVNRAVRSSPPRNPDGSPVVDPRLHQQQVADQGIQCFAAMLPFSDGVCGGVTDVRHARRIGVLVDSSDRNAPQQRRSPPPYDLNSPPTALSVARGAVVGRSGRLIPLTLGCNHGKPEKVAAFRKRDLQRLMAPPTPAPSTPTMVRAVTPMFKTGYRAAQYRNTPMPPFPMRSAAPQQQPSGNSE